MRQPIYKGKLKKSRIKVLKDGGANSNWVATEYFYDSGGHVASESITNHLGNTETKTYTYDFADNVMTENACHHRSQWRKSDDKIYLTIKRDAKKWVPCSSTSGTEVNISTCDYDHKNQLTAKHLGRHGTAGTHYYLQGTWLLPINAQVWFTHINNLSPGILQDHLIIAEITYRQAGPLHIILWRPLCPRHWLQYHLAW